MTNTETELKPLEKCPFCDGTNIDWEFSRDGRGNICPGCMDCGACGPESKTKEESMRRWNTRPVEAALQARIEELEAERRWVPVEEAMPPIAEGETATFGGMQWPASKPVLGLGPFGNVASDVMRWVEIGNRPRWISVAVVNDGFGEYEHVEIGGITHWMPLVAPPQK